VAETAFPARHSRTGWTPDASAEGERVLLDCFRNTVNR
jgi:hypothetical protein